MAYCLNGQNGTNGVTGSIGKGNSTDCDFSAGQPKNATGECGGMGKLVTPHVQITNSDYECKFLSCGIDSLDIGLYVEWPEDMFPGYVSNLEYNKLRAQIRQEPCLPDSGPFTSVLVYPTGKAMYKYHLHGKGYHVFLAPAVSPGNYPNVQVSFDAKMLWFIGFQDAVKKAISFIKSLSGEIKEIKISRCDICADFRITPELSHEFIKFHSVPDNRKSRVFSQGDNLETYYIGSPKSMVQARIYDKSKEIALSNKFWFIHVWCTDDLSNIWRLEFQLRREALKAYKVNTPDDLKARIAGIWEDLTTNWFTLRLHDDKNTSRRTIHPLWQQFQQCKYHFGKLLETRRDLNHDTAGADYYLSRAANNLLGYAATMGLDDLGFALDAFMFEMSEHWREKDFEQAYKAKNIKLNGVNEKEVG